VSSVRSRIIDAAISQLNTNTPAGVPAADDTRLESYTPGELPSILVFENREQGETEKEGRWAYFVKKALTLRVEIRIAETDVLKSRAAMDPIYCWCVQQIAAPYQGPTAPFGGLAEDCYESQLEWQYAAEDQAYTLLQIDFRVEYSTIKNDPTRTQ
jgi:hypothetical protein